MAEPAATGRDLVSGIARPPAALVRHFTAVSATGRAPGRSGGDDPEVEAGIAVRRLLDLLDTLAPGAAVLARGCLPRCDSTFGAGLALFLAATAGGCRDWLGADAAARLAVLDGGLLIDDCERALAPRFQTVGGRGWRLVRVPMADTDHGLLCAVAVEDGLSDRVTLVLQAKPPRLGPVQLMATLAARRLDATLRLATGLPSAAQADLHDSFRLVLADCRLDGTLTVGPLADDWLGMDRPLSSDVAV